MSSIGNPHSFEILDQDKNPVMGAYCQQERSGEDGWAMFLCKQNALKHLSMDQLEEGLKVLAKGMQNDSLGEIGGSTACVTLGRIRDVKDEKSDQLVSKAELVTLSAGDSFSTLVILNADGTFHSTHLLNNSIHQPNPYDERTKKEWQRVMEEYKNLNNPQTKPPGCQIINDKTKIWRLGSGLSMTRAYGDDPHKIHGLSNEAEISSKTFALPPGGYAFVAVTTDILEALDVSPKPGEEEKPTVISEIVTKMFADRPANIGKALVEKGRETYYPNEPKDDGTGVVFQLGRRARVGAVFDGHGQNPSPKHPVQCGNGVAGRLSINLKQRFCEAFGFSSEWDLIESSSRTPVTIFIQEIENFRTLMLKAVSNPPCLSSWLGLGKYFYRSDFIQKDPLLSLICVARTYLDYQGDKYLDRDALKEAKDLINILESEEKYKNGTSKEHAFYNSIIREKSTKTKMQIYHELRRSGFFTNDETLRKKIFAMACSVKINKQEEKNESNSENNRKKFCSALVSEVIKVRFLGGASEQESISANEPHEQKASLPKGARSYEAKF